MKILLINKFLFKKGGSETYVFKLGETLQEYGHSVEYFGLQNSENIVGNSINSFVSEIDFSKGIKKNLFAPFRIIYSIEARRKLRKVLESFKPDVVHFNNIQFHLTPSIILEANKYRKKHNENLKMVYTAHDYQLVCPSHGLFDTKIKPCEDCLNSNFMKCIKKRCIKNSRVMSILATIDAYFWKINKAYSYIDTIICPSNFLKSKLDTQERFKSKTTVIHNFIEKNEYKPFEKQNYVLEFGHLSVDKGTLTLLEVARRMPFQKFVFAGYGPAVDSIKTLQNAEYVGFKTGKELKKLIGSAAVSVCPSEMYENCPYSVMESQMLSTPVLGADIGGIPELINKGKTGELFIPGNSKSLEEKLKYMLQSDNISQYTKNCLEATFETPQTYYQKLISIYED